MKNTIKKIKGFKLCGDQSYCPSVEFKGKNVFIKDDYGNKVQLSKEEWKCLTERIKKEA